MKALQPIYYCLRIQFCILLYDMFRYVYYMSLDGMSRSVFRTQIEQNLSMGIPIVSNDGLDWNRICVPIALSFFTSTFLGRRSELGTSILAFTLTRFNI